ncbi:MAG: hypothetical protein JXC85_02375 [Candidatus Aenigmarchaeota archaeon]|nr:hypothetical protein [Candidatus Aenigmarchaeota archaeon]
MPVNSKRYNDGLGADELSKLVVNLIVKQYDILSSCVYRNTNFSQNLGGNSMDLLSLGLAIEENCGFEAKSIPDEVINSWRTVGQVVDYVQANAKKR